MGRIDDENEIVIDYICCFSHHMMQNSSGHQNGGLFFFARQPKWRIIDDRVIDILCFLSYEKVPTECKLCTSSDL